ncbi:hypothetical protein FOCC_FOCC012123 [Frankliniella occidentalis]|nr:hypothetical protein FOCC_FOCC012123 [Frankliniella occidentalis]
MVDTILLGQPCPKTLQLDQSCLEVYSTIPHQIDLWHQYIDCYLCNATHWTTIPPNGTAALLMNSALSSYFYYTNELGHKYCNTTVSFDEHATYGWNISEASSCSSVKKISNPSTHPHLPFVVAFLVYGIGAVLWSVARCVYRQEWSARVWLLNVTFSELENDLGSPQTREISPAMSRLGSTRRQINSRVKSLDTFRGICIAMMIFVNYGGGQYRFFRHTPWNGMNIADVIFPWFLWVMGMSLVLSLRSQLRSDRSRFSVWITALRRSVMLVLLGLLLNSFGHLHNDLSNFRFGGVLQRLGASFFIISSVETIFMNLQGPSQYGLLSDFWDGWAQWVCALAFAGTWMLITFLVDVPNCGPGYVGPGGLHKFGKFENCTGGASGYLDRMILHPNHMYQNPTCKKLYQSTQPYDPEGLLGTLTAAFLVHLGVHASRIMLCYDYSKRRIARWLFWGVVAVMTGLMLCGFSKETGHIPINKNLFSLSFVLVTGGSAYLVFAALYFLIDVRNWWSGAPFNYAGMNSIVLFVGHEITRNMFPWSWKPYWGTHGEYLGMNLWGTTLWIIIAFYLFKRNIFVTI